MAIAALIAGGLRSDLAALHGRVLAQERIYRSRIQGRADKAETGGTTRARARRAARTPHLSRRADAGIHDADAAGPKATSPGTTDAATASATTPA
jgi:hypothetical protein